MKHGSLLNRDSKTLRILEADSQYAGRRTQD